MTNKGRYKRGFARRGFNLIEIAIVVVVIGILGSAVLVPLTAALVEEQYEREAAAMERARVAVMGYAARSQTPRVRILSSGGNRGVTPGAPTNPTPPEDIYVVPGGRAYFPCPDITGDGNEDRNYYHYDGTDIAEYWSNTARGTPIIDEGGTSDGVLSILHEFSYGAQTGVARPLGDLRTVGSCSAMRGFLPWKTLGLPPTDTWGNLRTYAVDASYSHAVAGFNQNTRTDNFYTHGLMDETTAPPFLLFPRRDIIYGLLLAGTADTNIGLAINFNVPIGLCIGVGGVVCSIANVGNGSAPLAFGDKPTFPTTAPEGCETDSMGHYICAHRYYPASPDPNDLQDGLIFVIVSHGRNGFGAGKYNPGGGVSCNPGVFTNTNHERVNYPFVSLPRAAAQAPAFASTTNCGKQNNADRSPGLFTTLRRNDKDADTAFDDVMVWATRDDVNAAITRDSPDLPLYIEAP